MVTQVDQSEAISTLQAMIQVTENAANALKDLLKEEGQALRLVIQKGGCAGHQYGMKVDVPQADDEIVETSGGRVVVDPESLTFLQGSVVDYSESLTDSGFKITNPNAARSCGCGTSFEPAEEGKDPAYEPSMDGTVCKSEAEEAHAAE